MTICEFVETDEYHLMTNMIKVDRDRIRKLEAKMNDHQKELAEQAVRIQELETKDSKLEGKIDEQQSTISTIQAQLERAELKDSEEKEDSDSMEFQRIMEKNSQLESENQKLTEEFRNSQVEFTLVTCQLADLKQGLGKKLNEMQSRYDDLNREVATLESRILKEILDRQRAEIEVEEFSRELETVNSRNEDLEAELAELKGKLADKKDEQTVNQELEAELTNLKSKLAENKQTYLETTEDLFMEKKLAEIEVEKVTRELGGVNLKYRDLEAELAELKGKLAEHQEGQEKDHKIMEDLEAELAELKGKLAEHQEEQLTANLKNEKLEAELTNLKSKLAEVQEGHKKDEKTLEEQLCQKNQKLEAELTNLKSKLVAKNKKKDQKILNMEAELAELRVKWVKRKVTLQPIIDLKAANLKNQELEAELIDLKSKLAENQETHEKDQKILADLQAKLAKNEEHILEYQEFAKKTWIEGARQKFKYNQLEAELEKRLVVEKREEYKRMVEEAIRKAAAEAEEEEEEADADADAEADAEPEDDAPETESEESEDSDESGDEDDKSTKSSSWEEIFFGHEQL